MDTPRQPAERSSPSTPDGTGRDEHATPYPAAPGLVMPGTEDAPVCSDGTCW
ncbi:hypothetical protein TBS_17180 [Thermobispora bispora]|jgi:hypothetical protein|uniref:Uncharacterized protein n=1 Tax=Thermobispora bispora (strain ATCC 19993 / DSM 43833 / CBS 139.67 / JCM 10125 / KCTC 9307 / NBRC 14880 / R51) TaxID=469371 RepID=D6YAI6_THEBD|nr:hypothetical protein [Thermobispora bispora]ADG90239.1 hypothetical protein Tbis_3551 [Thermobispora bispora DSM 43833]MBX6167177.1 hypothetical protein [Thermobispora bispora]MDI9579914.1 hypothetical protein [Thermobispora sp.]